MAATYLGMTSLHFAARNGDMERIKALISIGADFSTVGGHKGNRTALHYAAEKSYFFAIYLTLLANSLTREDCTSLLMHLLEQALISNLKQRLLNLRQVLQQVIPAQLMSVFLRQVQEAESLCSCLAKKLPLFFKEILPQLIPKTFVAILEQVLREANPKDFSPEFEAILTHVQQLKSFNISTISDLLPILQHTNDMWDFAMLLEKILEKIRLETSAGAVIDSSPPIFISAHPIEHRHLEKDVAAENNSPWTPPRVAWCDEIGLKTSVGAVIDSSSPIFSRLHRIEHQYLEKDIVAESNSLWNPPRRVAWYDDEIGLKTSVCAVIDSSSPIFSCFHRIKHRDLEEDVAAENKLAFALPKAALSIV